MFIVRWLRYDIGLDFGGFLRVDAPIERPVSLPHLILSERLVFWIDLLESDPYARGILRQM